MGNLSIVYYTSNAEDPMFEKRVRDNISRVTNLPIISVSQKPIGFGKNFCVGDIGKSYLNEWKQILIGLKLAKTRFCIAAESDCLYPPEYFTFVPLAEDLVYRYSNVWAYWKNRNKFWRKPKCEGAQMCGREYWIERLESALASSNNPNEISTRIFEKEGRWGGNPVITFLTGDGISTKTSMCKEPPVDKLPYWGTASEIRERMFQ